jgi:hypothetical protein
MGETSAPRARIPSSGVSTRELRLRLPTALYERAMQAAQERQVSLTALGESAFLEYLERQGAGRRVEDELRAMVVELRAMLDLLIRVFLNHTPPVPVERVADMRRIGQQRYVEFQQRLQEVLGKGGEG